MQLHTKIYLLAFSHPIDDPTLFVPCEICQNKMIDVHHITAKRMGGSKLQDFIENLMGLCTFHHKEYGDKSIFMNILYKYHLMRMKEAQVQFDEKIINDLIYKYS